MVSRLPFALADAMREISALVPHDEMTPAAPVELHLEPKAFFAVVSELEHHHGAQLQTDPKFPKHAGSKCVRYAGMRIVATYPGNRNG